MPRKPVPVLERTFVLPNVGTVTLEVTANPLKMDSTARALFNHALMQLEAIELASKGEAPALPATDPGDGGKTH